MAALSRAVLLCGVLLAAGCFLPISTAAPQPARTVGKGEWGLSFSSELPTLNLIAEDMTAEGDSRPDDLVAPANSMTLGVQYGLTNHIDLEAYAEGAMIVFIVPVPLGGSAGLRAHMIHTDFLDLALAGRVGHIGVTSDDDHADATYLAGSVVLQLNPGGRFRPGIALQELPATIDVALSGEMPSTFKGAASSLTFSLEYAGDYVSFTPFVTVTSFDSPDIDSARFVSFGVQLARRNNVPPPAPPPPPPPPPPQSMER
jgi:hypothetical protein